MAICKFYAASGNCRFGDNCRFEHIDSRPSSRNYSSTYSKSYNTSSQTSSSSSSHHGSNSRLNFDDQGHQKQQQPLRSDGRASFSFNKAATQIPQQSGGSTFSFNRAAAGQNPPPASTFSFNKAAEMVSSGGPKTFSFANTHHQVNMNGGSGAGGGGGSSTVFGIPTSSTGAAFSFNDMLARVQNEKATFFQQPQQQQQQQPSFFGNQTPSNLPQQQTTSFFNNINHQQQQPQHTTTSQTPSFFNVPANGGSSIFGGGNISSQSGSQLASFVFGGKDPGGLNSNATTAITTTPSHCQWYTPLEELTDDDRTLFEQKEFTALIPLVPPPLEMCH